MGFWNRVVAELNDISEWSKLLPFPDALSLFRQMRRKVAGGYLINHKPWGAPFYLRNNISDKAIFRQVFFEQQYAPVTRLMPKADFIIDAGANIGMSARYFHLHYPNATIAAIEPEPANLQQLQKNISGISCIHPIDAGLWYKAGHIQILNEDAMAASFMVGEADAGIGTVTIPELMNTYNFRVVDILKIDIEGAEKELFSNGAEEWLKNVKLLIIELHDEMKPGCSKALFNALLPFNFTMVQNHENMFIQFNHA